MGLRKFLNFLWWLKIKLKATKKSKEAVLLLKKLKAWNDIKKVYAKSGEKGVPNKKALVEKKGKKAVGVRKQKKPLVGKEAVVTKKPVAVEKTAEKKPTTEEKKAAA